jgi:hypothetical protein
MKIIRIIAVIIVGSLIFVLAQNVWAGMTSDQYKIWLDSLGTGGAQSAGSTGYNIDSNLTTQTGGNGQSASFQEKTSFSGIANEPTVGFSVQSVDLNFGQLSASSTAYSSHIFSAYTNSNFGYTIKVYGQSLHSGEFSIAPIGAGSQISSPGTEQFGINLASNAVPLVGQDPEGGIGFAMPNYNQADKFAFSDGAVIAKAASFTYQTDYTVSVIVNIAKSTPAGLYGTTLTYEFIPVF